MLIYDFVRPASLCGSRFYQFSARTFLLDAHSPYLRPSVSLLIIHGDATRSVHIFHWGSTWPMVDQLSSRLAAVLALPSEYLAEPRSETRTVTGSQGHSYEAYQAYVHGTLGSTHSDRWMVSLLYPLSHQLLCIVVTLHYRMSWNRRHRDGRTTGAERHEGSCGARRVEKKRVREGEEGGGGGGGGKKRKRKRSGKICEEKKRTYNAKRGKGGGVRG